VALVAATVLGALPSLPNYAEKFAPIKTAEAQLMGGEGGPMNIAQSIATLMMLFQIMQKTNNLEGKQQDRSRDAMSNLSNSLSGSDTSFINPRGVTSVINGLKPSNSPQNVQPQ
jgi:hypothetical protein